MTSKKSRTWGLHRGRRKYRRGIVVVLTGFLMVALFGFMALAVDTGRIVLTKTQMQNAVDAAALAAATEISASVRAAGQEGNHPDTGSESYAAVAARAVAVQTGVANGVYVDQADVYFGKRVYNHDNEDWSITWGAEPFNAVRVVASHTNSDTTMPDGALKLVFGWAVGRDSAPLTTSSTAFVEARDLVLVCDFSGSMNNDSSLKSIDSLGLDAVEDQLDAMWDALVDADLSWTGTSINKFSSAGFGKVNSYAGEYISSGTKTKRILKNLKLRQNNPDGTREHPFPQAGRYQDGSPKPKPTNKQSDKLWYEYINHVKNLDGPYRNRYGYRTLVDFLQEKRFDWYQSEDLWRTPHYPFHAVKEGASLFLNYLHELNFGDEVGLVGYGRWAVTQMDFYDGELDIDLKENPITDQYHIIDAIQRRHQAGEYGSWTAMGDGILHARELLIGRDNNFSDQGFVRPGAKPTMIVMTDGQTNQKPEDWSLPENFNWKQWADYDGDGNANYTTSNEKKQYAFWEATESIKRGITIHTMAVGQGADRELMEAIAFAGSGLFISVPGGTSIMEMEEQVLEAFSVIASHLPPPKLVYDLSVIRQ
ncbi:MAG: VWA domain-containing protein [Pirellulales bacterium]|nr:VWA domain-containing protein [Pirellulales bacterium]